MPSESYKLYISIEEGGRFKYFEIEELTFMTQSAFPKANSIADEAS